MFNVKAFSQFIAPDVDRCAFIQNYLFERGVQSAVINVDGKRHIYAKLPAFGYSAKFRVKTLIAHYDRCPSSPGANDNSAAVFCLMDFAARLLRFKGVHNVRIFFTDGEELVSGGVKEQGAYALANVIQKAGIKDEDVYVFDCMGRGAVPILGETFIPKNASKSFVKKYNALEQGARNVLSSIGLNHLSLPIPYSDNAGFLASGIPAVVFTMLPDNEAQNYIYALQNVRGLLESIQNRIGQHGSQNRDLLKQFLPETWRLIHTAGDDINSLTPASFEITAKILDAIAQKKSVS